MQTRIGWTMLCAVGLIAVALAWTGNLTGWFKSDDVVSLSWGYLALGTILALGIVKLIDRAIWASHRRAEIASEKADIDKKKAKIAKIHEARQNRVGINLATIMHQALKEPSIGPVDEEEQILAPRAKAQ